MENELQGMPPVPPTEALTPTPPTELETELPDDDGATEQPAEIDLAAGAGDAPQEVPEAPDYAALAREDLAALTAEVAELAGLTSLSALPDPARYGELRELGLSPAEAYYATAGGRAKRATAADRAHLAASVGRAAATAGVRPSAAELAEARDLFPSLTDREIEALYRRAVTRQA
jgi:hypothetical protein